MGEVLATGKRFVCPHCVGDRKKKDAKDLQVFEDGYYCFHCGKGGKIDEKGKLIQGAGNKPPLSDDKIKGGLIKKAIEFFNGRGISEATLQAMKITADATGIKFPYFWDKKLQNIKYRSFDKKFHQEKDRDKIFYNLDSVTKKEVIITEGEIDVLSLIESRYESVISVPDGAPAPNVKNYKSKFDYLDNCVDVFRDIKKIIIAVDNDAPGNVLKQELVRRLDPVRCWVVTWPEGCKDANDVLVKYGKLGLVNAIEGAELVPISGITQATDYKQEIDNDYECGGVLPGINTGVGGLEKLYTVRPGQVTIVTGIPSHGKSSLLAYMLVNLSSLEGWRHAIFSPENNPLSHFIEKIMALRVGKAFDKKYSDRMSREEKDRSLQWVSAHFKHISPTIDEFFTTGDILKRAVICVERYGVRGLVIDPWNEINHERKGGLTETEHISRCLSEIRKFARVYGVHVWVVAHPTKLQKGLDGKVPAPTAYDISGSSNFYNKADNIFCVHRDVFDESRKVKVYVQKIRFRDIGQPGEAELTFDIATGRYKGVTEMEKLSMDEVFFNSEGLEF